MAQIDPTAIEGVVWYGTMEVDKGTWRLLCEQSEKDRARIAALEGEANAAYQQGYTRGMQRREVRPQCLYVIRDVSHTKSIGSIQFGRRDPEGEYAILRWEPELLDEMQSGIPNFLVVPEERADRIEDLEEELADTRKAFRVWLEAHGYHPDDVENRVMDEALRGGGE